MAISPELKAALTHIQNKKFEIYTYELLPGNSFTYIPEYKDKEDVLTNKNKILKSIFTTRGFHFFRVKGTYQTTLLLNKQNIIIFRVARRFEITLIDREAKEHREDNWPYLLDRKSTRLNSSHSGISY